MLATVTWKKGQSGNPLGRPRNALSLAAAVRDMVDPEEIAEFATRIMRDEQLPISERWKAAEFLSDRGWGKPVAPVVLDGLGEGKAAALRLDVFSESDLAALEALLLRATGQDEPADDTTPEPAPPGVIDV